MKTKRFIRGKFFPVLFAILAFSSCKKEKTPAENLVGSWTLESTQFSTMIGAKTLTQYLTEDAGLTTIQAGQFILLFNQQLEQSFAGTIQINSDNTFTSTFGGVSDSGTWILSSDNKRLTIVSDTELPYTLDIIELTSGRLHLQGVETGSQDLNGDQVNETIIITIDLMFTK